ncbi:hypothetical protein M758_5G062100 [Ceratodon purpureus]|nr:hypothetical protein M758_5G062100 [Ceratodon purpureus]
MEEDAFGNGQTEVHAQEAAHPALRKFADVLRTFEDCSKELEGIKELLIGEDLAFARSAWREELHLVAVHAREKLTQLTQEVQGNLSLLSFGEMLSPSEGTAESDGKTICSSIVESDANLDESSRRESHFQRWCPHACEAHNEMMDPALWRKLPEYLVELIFARLPLNKVVQLQSLSKYWRYAVKMSKPFHRSCSEFSAQRFALVTSNQCRDCKIHFCDVKEKKWLLKTMDAVSYGFWASPVIAAGGLLCIVDLHQLSYGALSISMCNPLTNKSRVLPPLTHYNRWFPKMMQLLVDDSTCHYKLIVVGSSHRSPDTLMMEVYDSQTELWKSSDENPAPGKTYRDSTTSVCGYDFSYDGQYEGIVRYDTKERSLYRLVFPSHPNMVQPPSKNEIGMYGGDVFAVVSTLRNKELLYKLWTDPHTGNVEWVPQYGSSSSFASVNNLVSFPRTYYKRVFVAGSLVLVAADNRERADLNHHQILMLKDFSGDNQWIQLPKLGYGEKCDMWELNHAIMMELRWDATP